MRKLVLFLTVLGSLSLLAVGLASSGLATNASARHDRDGRNRFEASFSETAASITVRVADLQTVQVINTGSGTVEGFGAASVVAGITQDRSVTPCGPGSSTNAATRRIVVDGGVLILREVSFTCPSASGPPVVTGTYRVDGLSSTGIFAGARGSGDVTVILVQPRTTTLSGKLKLAPDSGGGDD